MASTLKLHQSIQLTWSEINYSKIFNKSYIITGDSQQTMDFMQYHAGYFSGENFHQFVRQAHHTCNPVIQEDNPYPDLNANEPPWSSSSKDSNPDLRHIIDTGLDVNLFSEDSKSWQSAKLNLIHCKLQDLVKIGKNWKTYQAYQKISALLLKLY